MRSFLQTSWGRRERDKKKDEFGSGMEGEGALVSRIFMKQRVREGRISCLTDTESSSKDTGHALRPSINTSAVLYSSLRCPVTSLISRTGPIGSNHTTTKRMDQYKPLRSRLVNDGLSDSPGPIPRTVLLPAAICVLPASWMSLAQRLSDCAVAWRRSRSSSDAI